MNSKAQKYIKPSSFVKSSPQEETKNVTEQQETPAESKRKSNARKSIEQTSKLEQSHDATQVSEQDQEESSSESSEDETVEKKEEPKKKQPPELSQILTDPKRPQVAQRASALVLQKATISLPGPEHRTFSIISKQRKSTFDPSTLKRLKTIKIETLNSDDQIELAILILQKAFENRTTVDLNFLVKCTENVGFFKKYDEGTHRECMAKMYHVHLNQGDPCINFGEFGETFWVTLKGRVGILVPIEKEVVDKNGEMRKEKVLTRVAGQGPGYAFGELALLERKPRAATIVCEDDCDFAILDKTPFQQILQEKEEKRLFAEVNFLKNLKIFSHWAYNSIRSLFMYSQLRTFTRNQIVYHQSDPAEGMYIIKTGEFKVSYRAQFESEKIVLGDQVIDKYMKKRAATRDIELAILGTCEIFGVEELINGTNRKNTVVCNSQTALVLQIGKKEAKSLVLNETSAKTWLQIYLNSRAEVQNKRINNIHKNTKKFQMYLMRTATDNSVSKKEAAKQLLQAEPTEEDLDIPDNILYYRRRNPEEDRAHTLGSEPEDAHKFVGMSLPTESDGHRSREIPCQKWSEDGWLDTKRSSLLDTKRSSLIDTYSAEPAGNSSQMDTLKLKSMHSSITNTGKEEEPPLRLSITEKMLKEYREKLKIHRTKSNDRFSKTPTKARILPQSVGYSQEIQLSDGTWGSDESRSRFLRSKRSMENLSNPKHSSSINYSPNLSQLESISPVPREYLQATGTSFHLKLHHVLPSQSQSVERKPSPLKNIIPLYSITDSKNFSENIAKTALYRQIQTRQALLSAVDDHIIRGRISRNLNIDSKRVLDRKGGPGQTFYNEMIPFTESSSHKREKAGSPINLRLREKLMQIKKLSEHKANQRRKGSAGSERIYNNEDKVLTTGNSNELFDSINNEESVRTPIEITPIKRRNLQNDLEIQPRLSDSIPRNLSNISQMSSLPKIGGRYEIETPIKITDQFYGGV